MRNSTVTRLPAPWYNSSTVHTTTLRDPGCVSSSAGCITFGTNKLYLPVPEFQWQVPLDKAPLEAACPQWPARLSEPAFLLCAPPPGGCLSGKTWPPAQGKEDGTLIFKVRLPLLLFETVTRNLSEHGPANTDTKESWAQTSNKSIRTSELNGNVIWCVLRRSLLLRVALPCPHPLEKGKQPKVLKHLKWMKLYLSLHSAVYKQGGLRCATHEAECFCRYEKREALPTWGPWRLNGVTTSLCASQVVCSPFYTRWSRRTRLSVTWKVIELVSVHLRLRVRIGQEIPTKSDYRRTAVGLSLPEICDETTMVLLSTVSLSVRFTVCL